MTAAQAELREERIAIMLAESVPREEAEAYCDGVPSLYGIRDREEKQGELI